MRENLQMKLNGVNYIKLIVLIVVVTISFVGCTIDNQYYKTKVTNEKDISIIKDRLVFSIMSEDYRYYQMDINEEPIKEPNDGYYLASINYEEQQPSYWQAIRHLEYTMQLVKSNKEQIANDKDIRAIVLGLIDYWIKNDYQNEPNWYYNQIGVPLDLADISLMMLDYLGEERIEKIAEILDRGTIGRGVEDINVQGANGTDFIRISMSNAIITNDVILMNESVSTLNSIIKKGDYKENGIQEDMSYIGNTVLYGGSAYPITFLTNVIKLASLINGTNFSIEDDKKELLVDFILDGQRFFHRNDGVPNFSLGRSAYQASGGRALQDIIYNIIQLGWEYRLAELKNYYSSFEDKSSVNKTLKFFPVAGMLVDLSKDSYMAVKGYQSDMSMTDIQNQEGVLNYNFCYGSNTCFMDVGDEYSSVSEVYDWSMLPGTTTYKESDSELYLRFINDYDKTWGYIGKVKTYPPDCYGEADHLKGVGVMVSPLSHDGISGKNIFIMFDNRLFCLGAGFSSSG